MFTVLLVVCIGQNPQCFNIRDDWGPYTSLEQCGQRLEQLALNVEQNFSPVIFFFFPNFCYVIILKDVIYFFLCLRF